MKWCGRVWVWVRRNWVQRNDRMPRRSVGIANKQSGEHAVQVCPADAESYLVLWRGFQGLPGTPWLFPDCKERPPVEHSSKPIMQRPKQKR